MRHYHSLLQAGIGALGVAGTRGFPKKQFSPSGDIFFAPEILQECPDSLHLQKTILLVLYRRCNDVSNFGDNWSNSSQLALKPLSAMPSAFTITSSILHDTAWAAP